jgi:hypothetical protein
MGLLKVAVDLSETILQTSSLGPVLILHMGGCSPVQTLPAVLMQGRQYTPGTLSATASRAG